MKTVLLLVVVVLALLVTTTERYIGASKRERSRYPWFVSLGPEYDKPICGGVLVHPKLVLTAGHCIIDSMKFAWLKDDDGKIQKRKVKKVVKHYEKQQNQKHEADLGVIVVEEPFDSTPISIGLEQNLKHGMDIHAIGHGRDEKGNTGVLKKTTVTYVNPGDCYYGAPQPSFFCTKSRRRGACFGDSGGPAFIRHSKTDFLVGLVSHGPKDCRKIKNGKDEYLYSVFTDMTNPLTLKRLLDLMVSLV